MSLRVVFLSVVLVSSATALAQTYTYYKIEDSVAVDNGGPGAVGWGSCVTCAGGDPQGTASIASSPLVRFRFQCSYPPLCAETLPRNMRYTSTK
jgi:hypothetical protein